MQPTRQIYPCLESYFRQEAKTELLHFARILGQWSTIVGEKWARFARPLCVKNGKLYVAVADRGYAQAMEMRKKRTLDYVKVIIESRDVREIVFRVSDSLFEDDSRDAGVP